MIGSQGGSASGGNMGNVATPRTSQAPVFNVVGSAPENQLAQTIEGQQQKPIKAFVVSNEVSNQQALDRQIENTASIG
jgi:hypothetical protein